MKKIMIVWIIVVLILVGSLTGYGLYLKSTYGKYYELEKRLADAAKDYYGQYPGSLPATSVTIESQKLIDENFLDNLDNNCSGYALVTKSGIAYKYKGFIKCENYTTKKYVVENEA